MLDLDVSQFRACWARNFGTVESLLRVGAKIVRESFSSRLCINLFLFCNSQSLSLLATFFDSLQIFVSELYNNRISVFSLSGSFIRCFGQEGSSKGKLQRPEGICISPDEQELFVADTFRVQVFNPDGLFLRMWGSEGNAPRQHFCPCGVEISGSRSEVFVSDLYNHRLCVYRPDGTFLRALGGGKGSGDGQLSYPQGLALSMRGTVLVCEHGNHRVSELRVTDGAFVCKWGKNGGVGEEDGRGQEGEFNHPTAVTVSNDGELFVSDKDNHRIQVFV